MDFDKNEKDSKKEDGNRKFVGWGNFWVQGVGGRRVAC